MTDQTVLRAGYGISYPPETMGQDGPNLSPINLAPTSVVNTFQVQTDSPNSILATTANPFPFRLSQPLRRNATPSFFYGQSTFAMRVPGNPKPYVQQWNAAVERQISKDASLTVAYAGSRGTHLLLQGWATVPFYGMITTPGSPLSQPTVAAGQLLRPYPQFERALALDPHAGTSNYRSLQASFMKRFGEKGILSVAYTWSRLMSNTDSVTAFLSPWATTPGTSISMLFTFLPLRGMLSTSRWPMTVPREALSVCNGGASVVTTTLSVALPACRSRLHA